METEISQLVSRYDGGTLSRRELIRGLAMISAAAVAAGNTEQAAAATPFRGNSFGHVSIQVKDLDRSVKFYREIFGLPVDDKIVNPPGEFRLNVGRSMLVMRNVEPYGSVDHFAIGADRFDRAAATAQLKKKGIEAIETHGPRGFYILDPDGYPVQIVSTENQ
jgi:catechol 2,3-dioxygenase-like lactoylglutathione lyase family enzyme